MKFKAVVSSLIFSAAFVTLTAASSHAAPCSQGHCGSVNEALNRECIALGFAGRPFPVIGPTGSVCTCPCSCVAFGTEVSTPKGEVKIEDLNIGDEVTQVYNGAKSAKIDKILKTELDQEYPARKLSYAGRSIVVSGNHPFITPDFKAVQAQQVKAGDRVLNGKGEPVTIDANTEQRYTGSLYNLIINSHSESPDDHVVVTNGIQSGDFLTQATLDAIQTEIDIRMGKVLPIGHFEKAKN